MVNGVPKGTTDDTENTDERWVKMPNPPKTFRRSTVLSIGPSSPCSPCHPWSTCRSVYHLRMSVVAAHILTEMRCLASPNFTKSSVRKAGYAPPHLLRKPPALLLRTVKALPFPASCVGSRSNSLCLGATLCRNATVKDPIRTSRMGSLAGCVKPRTAMPHTRGRLTPSPRFRRLRQATCSVGGC